MAGSVSLACANEGGAVAWVVPVYKNSRAVWRFAERMTAHVTKKLSINKTERLIEFPSGGFLGIYTADNPTSILGEAFDLVVAEEAARIAPDVWQETILPTLADRDGQALLISTPKGKNWFYNEYQSGLSDGKEWASFNAPTSANPMPSIQGAVKLIERRVKEGRYSQKSYQQEWLAQFVDDGAGVFRNVRSLSTLQPIERLENHSYLIGVDWGRSNDFTVASVWDIGQRQEVELDRYTDLPFHIQYSRIKALAERYDDALIIAEANNAQDAHIEALAMMGLRVMPFITGNATKAAGVDQLALACERGDIAFQDSEVGISEMEAFESSRTATGLVKYSAPEGQHDDIPMARVIAYSGIAQSGPVILNSD